jgi:hypothetical protein
LIITSIMTATATSITSIIISTMILIIKIALFTFEVTYHNKIKLIMTMILCR